MSPEIRAYPLLCEPLLKAKIWGGRKLVEELGIPLPAGENIGEAWLAADLAEGESAVANGALAGRTLGEVTCLWGKAMIGPAWRGRPTGERFPLLVKFLDAQDDLSVQVHPDDAACREHFPGAFSKDESWVVVQADPGARIVLGFRPGITLEGFDRALAEGNVMETLQAREVAEGQVFRVAPRTVHALLRGVLILEIQEPSDTTFRLYDYDRPDDSGKLRQLHVAEARRVMRFGDPPGAIAPVRTDAPWGIHELLVDVPAYRIERARFDAPWQGTVDPRSAQVVVGLEGAARLTAGGESLRLRRGVSVVLPAALGAVRIEPLEDAPAVCVFAGAGGVPMVAGKQGV
jgi:mannose-6-phosphate isomerase